MKKIFSGTKGIKRQKLEIIAYLWPDIMGKMKKNAAFEQKNINNMLKTAKYDMKKAK